MTADTKGIIKTAVLWGATGALIGGIVAGIRQRTRAFRARSVHIEWELPPPWQAPHGRVRYESKCRIYNTHGSHVADARTYRVADGRCVHVSVWTSDLYRPPAPLMRLPRPGAFRRVPMDIADPDWVEPGLWTGGGPVETAIRDAAAELRWVWDY